MKGLGKLKIANVKVPAPVAGISKPASSIPGVVTDPVKPAKGLTIKTPKQKSLPDATDKPSLFFKNEDFSQTKHASVRKLRDFIQKTRSKK